MEEVEKFKYLGVMMSEGLGYGGKQDYKRDIKYGGVVWEGGDTNSSAKFGNVVIKC